VRERLALLRPIEPAPVSLDRCLAAALATARLGAGVIVKRSASLAHLPPVLASQEGLTLVLLNVLDNAAEALAGHGTVTVDGRALGDRIELTIADDGPGIAPELQARIFEFDFSGRRRAGQPARLGFGLWWVKTLMSRLGGAISVESDGRHGTLFRLHLPAATGNAG